MKTIIIEDEDFASRRLENMLAECDKSIQVIGKFQSVRESVAWLKSNPHPDLIFMDIQLDDDLSFAIFDQVEIQSNIIFTTAFDEYAIRAFKQKSIDYLLKPVNKDELQAAITKYKNWANNSPAVTYDLLKDLISLNKKEYRDRFLVTAGNKLKSIGTDQIAYFFSVSGISFLVTFDNRQYSLDLSLDTIYDQIDPCQFFRINRQYLISLKSMVTVHVFPKSRLKLELNPPVKEGIFVSIDKVPEFKRWIDGEK